MCWLDLNLSSLTYRYTIMLLKPSWRIMWLIVLILYLYSYRLGKKIVSFLILNKFSWWSGNTLPLFTGKEYRSVMLHAVFFHTTSSEDFHSLLKFVWKIKCALKWLLSNDLQQKRQDICILLHENSLSIKEIVINFLTRSVQIHMIPHHESIIGVYIPNHMCLKA